MKSIDGLEKAKTTIGCDRFTSDDNVWKISVGGVGMSSHAGVASTMFEALASRGINILAISTSEIKVSVLIAQEYTELAVRVLHPAYGLAESYTAAARQGAGSGKRVSVRDDVGGGRIIHKKRAVHQSQSTI